MSSRWQGRRVVVTGGSAFIGSFVAERLVALGAKVRVPLRAASSHVPFDRSDVVEWIEGDVSDPSFCTHLLQDVDELLHFASFRRNVSYHREHADEVCAKNTEMTTALIDALPSRGIPITFASTALVGVRARDAEQERKHDGYVIGKMECEHAWTRASRDRGFPLLIIRPVSVYGPRDTFTAESNVIPALIVRAAQPAKELTVWGSGRQQRSFVYAPDMAEAMLRLRAEGVEGTEYVCPPASVTIAEVAETIRDLVQPGLPVRFDAAKPHGPSLPPFPVHTILQSYPWTDIREGLRRTVEWYRAVR